MHRLLTPLLTVALIALGAACSGDAPGGSAPAPEGALLPTIIIEHEGKSLVVEVARTGEEMARGLGGRDALARDSGILFDYGGTRVPQLWMKGMRFPLDFVWIGEDRRVVEVTPDVAPQPGAPDGELRTYSPAAPARWALELNAGAAARLGIDPGDRLTFDPP